MNAAQLLCIFLCALLCAHGLAVEKSRKKQSVTNEPNPPPTNHSSRLIGECLQKKFTQSSCLKVFCLPWERCVDGKCLCKLPYQCPKNGTVQACSASKRTFRTYCQQKSYECLNPKEYFATLSADCSKAGTFSVKLKSEDGMVAKSNGTVEVLLPLAEKAKCICQKYWTTQEANVVCRQLGFNKGAAVPVVVTQNLTIPVSDRGCLQVTCRGPETSLTECIITNGLRTHNMEKAAEVQCVEESGACTKKQFQCVNEKCIPLSKVCDGINDCGDLSDELCCSECIKKAFHCHSDVCIPSRFRCNGELDCINGDDEKGCVDSPQKSAQDSLQKSAQDSPQKSAQEQKQTVVVNMDEERKLIKSSLPQLTCGIEYHRNTRQKRIVGGEKAHKDQFPWQVAIKDGESVNCGGIYIGGCWVLTAAHCVSASRPQQYRIMVGLLNRMEYDSDIDSFPVIQVNVHEDYNPSTYQNDIALLKVQNIYNEEKCMAADNTVMPACLPWSEYLFKAGDVCKVSGWGREEGFHKVFFLKWGHISLMSNCSAIYKERFYENMECAGTHDGSIDSCKGDSGGPLVCVDSNNVAYLWGIVSWGENCGLPGYPGVYTKVANYFEWISRLVGRQSISRYNV